MLFKQRRQNGGNALASAPKLGLSREPVNFVTRHHQKQSSVVVAAEQRRGNAARRGKIHFHPQIAFVRENLVRRAERRSSQFSAPIFGRKRRGPTNEECRRLCPAHLDRLPDNREFPAPEMEAKGRYARIDRYQLPQQPACHRNLRFGIRNTGLSLPASASFNSSSKICSPKKRPEYAQNTNPHRILERAQDNFAPLSWPVFAADWWLPPVSAQARTILSMLRRSFARWGRGRDWRN